MGSGKKRKADSNDAPQQNQVAPWAALPQELLNIIFSFVSPQDCVQLLAVCRSFNLASAHQLMLFFNGRGARITAPPRTISAVQNIMTASMQQKLSDLYAILSELRNYLAEEDWNVSCGTMSKITHESGTAYYETKYLPSTLPRDNPAFANYHLTTYKEQIVLSVQGRRINIGYRLEFSERVSIVSFIRAIQDMIDFLLVDVRRQDWRDFQRR